MKIQVLNPEVVDQIAAGEVLERPANMVKELLENSLDAGADEIEIEFNSGGREVAITDNGSGMAPGDLSLALQRHATSKIKSSDDLYRLNTFGFRGEALASLAAVSRLTLTSRAPGQNLASQVHADFGQLSDLAEASAAVGTQVRVRDLFENVPARLRFLKSEGAEASQIRTTIKAMALAHENVGFRVRHRGELVFHWPKGQSFAQRAHSVLAVKKLFLGFAEDAGSKVEVLLTAPNETFQANRNVWLFAQGRWIQDRSISAAVIEGYRNLLMHGEYPCAVVRLQVPPEEIDVNVHPAKAQVKFADSQKIFRLVRRAVRDVLERAPWLEEVRPTVGATALHEPLPPDLGEQSTLPFDGPEFSQTHYNTKVFPLAEVRESVAEYRLAPIVGSAPSAFKWSDLHVIGQAHQTYIVAQSGESFYLVDQHAAHERVVFERLMSDFRKGRLEVQNLLLPLAFDLDDAEVDALMPRQEFLAKLGFSIERLGPSTVGFTTLPSLISESAVQQGIKKMAHELVTNDDDSALERVIGDIYASMACHSVVRAGQTLSVEQMSSLLAQMDDFPLSSFCPHGRPVYIQRRFSEIEREFGRIL